MNGNAGLSLSFRSPQSDLGSACFSRALGRRPADRIKQSALVKTRSLQHSLYRWKAVPGYRTPNSSLPHPGERFYPTRGQPAAFWSAPAWRRFQAAQSAVKHDSRRKRCGHSASRKIRLSAALALLPESGDRSPHSNFAVGILECAGLTALSGSVICARRFGKKPCGPSRSLPAVSTESFQVRTRGWFVRQLP